MDMVGGDFFDFIIRREGDIGILICDVSGHGSAAGFITAMLKIITSTSRKYAHIPSMFLKNVNYSIYNKIAENFVTAFYGVISADTKKFTYANAGHTFPILFRKEDSSIHRLVAKGGVLGVTNDLNFEQYEIDLYKGDKLFLYTDGVTETINDKRESYGRKRLYGFIKDNKDKDINLLVSQLFEDIKTFRQNNKTDDMAFVGLEIK
jgi:serine phosphatase RsbU (regulator of sigma subunit)